MIKLANDLGGAPMKLVHWKKIEELKRIPKHDEIHVVDALRGITNYLTNEVEIFMISHRWLRPSLTVSAHPDDINNSKATAITEFSMWRRQWVLSKHGFLPEIFYWIDFSCIDQENSDAAIPLLPLWVACCERFLRIETEDYNERAWCRIEPLLSYIYSFADHHIAIDIDYKCNWPNIGKEEYLPILDPGLGYVTNPIDYDLIKPLTELAVQAIPSNASRSNIKFNQSTIKCFKL